MTCEHGFYIFLFAGFILYFRWSSLLSPFVAAGERIR